MKYSFTQPLPKSIISHPTKIWLFYLFLSIGLVYGYGIYLSYQISTIKASTNSEGVDIIAHDEFIASANERTRLLQSDIDLEAFNKSHNADVNLAIAKLFDIIPDQITINFIELDEKKLTIKGITPTREAYTFLLGAPLKSAFSTSSADFYALPSGWFNFTSISTVESQ